MGRNSGGVVNITATGSGNGAKVQIALAQSKSLDAIKDRAVVKELNRAISRYHAVMGVKERDVRIADLSGMNALGVTWIDRTNGKSAGILLNEKFFDRKKGTVVNDIKKNHYDTGFKSRTNAPLQHNMTHELAHATWNASMTDAKSKAAGLEIKRLYKKWKKDKNKKGHGTYAATSVSEFWSETVTKAIHGTPDRYTRSVKRIARKYKL